MLPGIWPVPPQGWQVKEGEDLVSATRYGIMMLRFARSAQALDRFNRDIVYSVVALCIAADGCRTPSWRTLQLGTVALLFAAFVRCLAASWRRLTLNGRRVDLSGLSRHLQAGENLDITRHLRHRGELHASGAVHRRELRPLLRQIIAGGSLALNANIRAAHAVGRADRIEVKSGN